MIVQLTDDTIVHQAETDHPSGVPAVWALVRDGDDEDVFAVVYREVEDEEPWHLEWRGSYEKCRERYVENVTDAMLGDLLAGLPRRLGDFVQDGFSPRLRGTSLHG